MHLFYFQLTPFCTRLPNPAWRPLRRLRRNGRKKERNILVTPSLSLVKPSASIFLLERWLLRLVVVLRGSCQVISNLTIYFPSVRRQIGLPTIGDCWQPVHKTSGTSIELMLTLFCWVETGGRGRRGGRGGSGFHAGSGVFLALACLISGRGSNPPGAEIFFSWLSDAH